MVEGKSIRIFFFQAEDAIRFVAVTGVQTCSFLFQAEDGIRDVAVTGVQTCALPIWLSVGVGEYNISQSDIRIGETPITNYTGDVTYDIKAPGESVASIIAAENWYTSKEIGGTAGTSGSEERRVGKEGRSRWSQ